MNYQKAVNNIINNCLQVKAGDRVIVVTERDRLDIGQAIAAGAKKIAKTKLVTIEDFTDRPAKALPEKMADEIRAFAPTVSVYAATGKPGELPVFRAPLRDLLVTDLGCRHAHMIGINSQLMEEGMSQDYTAIQTGIAKLLSILKTAKQITVKDPHGTDLTVTFSPQLHWKPCDGAITKPREWSNLPEGECFTCPETANGTVVAWVIGDHFSDDYGVLQEPLVLTIKDSFITGVASKNTKLVEEFNHYISEYANGNRMGEFAIGALLGLKQLSGNLLQDEKFPGVHMAFGHPYPEETGQKEWDCESHVDVIPLEVDVDVDGRALLRRGGFVVPLT